MNGSILHLFSGNSKHGHMVSWISMGFPHEKSGISIAMLVQQRVEISRSTIPETNSSHLKHLGMEDEFPFGTRPPARCYVSFREGWYSRRSTSQLQIWFVGSVSFLKIDPRCLKRWWFTCQLLECEHWNFFSERSPVWWALFQKKAVINHCLSI